jgi:hypothetical protein
MDGMKDGVKCRKVRNQWAQKEASELKRERERERREITG